MWVFKKFSKCFASNKSAKMFYLKRVISFDSLEKCSKFKKRKEKKGNFLSRYLVIKSNFVHGLKSQFSRQREK